MIELLSKKAKKDDIPKKSGKFVMFLKQLFFQTILYRPKISPPSLVAATPVPLFTVNTVHRSLQEGPEGDCMRAARARWAVSRGRGWGQGSVTGQTEKGLGPRRAFRTDQKGGSLDRNSLALMRGEQLWIAILTKILEKISGSSGFVGPVFLLPAQPPIP